MNITLNARQWVFAVLGLASGMATALLLHEALHNRRVASARNPATHSPAFHGCTAIGRCGPKVE